ncbi:hypothetical protein WN943_024975 [Citrus x changshan-huyou]
MLIFLCRNFATAVGLVPSKLSFQPSKLSFQGQISQPKLSFQGQISQPKLSCCWSCSSMGTKQKRNSDAFNSASKDKFRSRNSAAVGLVLQWVRNKKETQMKRMDLGRGWKKRTNEKEKKKKTTQTSFNKKTEKKNKY